jgi:hypothetical protein
MLVRPWIKKTRTVQHALQNRNWVRDITGSLSVIAIIEYLHLWDKLEGIQLQPGQEDVVWWHWMADGRYSPSSAYKALIQGRSAFQSSELIWKSWAPLRVKLFLWLACRRRIWKADCRRRRGLDAHDSCWLCDQAPETVDHLLVNCPTARDLLECVHLGWVCLQPRQ